MGFTRNYAFLKYCECIQDNASYGIYGKQRLKQIDGGMVPPHNPTAIYLRNYVYPLSSSGALTVGTLYGLDCAMRPLSVLVGSSAAAETFDDYTIATIANVSSTIASRTVSLDDNVLKTKFVINITNTSGSEQTINEVGIVLSFRVHHDQNNTSSDYSSSYSCLVYRKKLDVPIIVAANGDASINLEVCHVY